MLKAPMLFFFPGRRVRALDRNGLFGLHRRARKTGVGRQAAIKRRFSY